MSLVEMIFPTRVSFIWRAKLVYSGNSNKVSLHGESKSRFDYSVLSRAGGGVLDFPCNNRKVTPPTARGNQNVSAR